MTKQSTQNPPIYALFLVITFVDTLLSERCAHIRWLVCSVLFSSHPRYEDWPHHGRIFSFISVLCHSDWLFLGESCPCCPSRPCVVFLACVQLALFLHYLFLQDDCSLGEMCHMNGWIYVKMSKFLSKSWQQTVTVMWSLQMMALNILISPAGHFWHCILFLFYSCYTWYVNS